MSRRPSHIRIYDGHWDLPAWAKARLLRRVNQSIATANQAIADGNGQSKAAPLPEVRELEIRARYFIHVEEELSAQHERDILAILNAEISETTEATSAAEDVTHLLYLPRLETVSMWSGKATDILHVAGYEQVRRVERGRLVSLFGDGNYNRANIGSEPILFDRMIERLCPSEHDGADIFAPPTRASRSALKYITAGQEMEEANRELALALSADELAFLNRCAKDLKRPLTDAEVMMFAQINSEHCRHKIFNADWTIVGEASIKRLFDMIRNTYRHARRNILTAYDDNAAVIAGASGKRWQRDHDTHEYAGVEEALHTTIKVETHNHPTAISPFAGAATGIGGEIRDEAATGRGGGTKAGLCGYTVSNLHLQTNCEFPEGFYAPWSAWETPPFQARSKSLIASAFEIMLKAPIGGASFGNEFGRPCLTGYFRTFERRTKHGHFGYDKPIMLAGGMGTVRQEHVKKKRFATGANVVVLGGPAMLIGLGGGTGSSQGGTTAQLDYASVQRSNPEMQRRCQEVIEQCMALGDKNPIESIHDVGAGGLSNAIPELLHDAGCGGKLQLRQIPSADSNLSPMEIWCNEAQERYVLAVSDDDALAMLAQLCERERCPMAVLGHASEDGTLRLDDEAASQSDKAVVAFPMNMLFNAMTQKQMQTTRAVPKALPTKQPEIDWREAAHRVLAFPAVAAKNFLITIGDRTVGGLSVRDQLVGPWQMPVADCAVCAADYSGCTGEAMAVGERTPVAMTDVKASVRLAVCEAITNMMAADVALLNDIKLSANWMASCSDGTDMVQSHNLYEAVQEVGEVLCPALGIAIPVGKDSLSMRIKRLPTDKEAVTSPVSLIVSAFAPVTDIRNTLTPQLRIDIDTNIYLIDLSSKNNNLGESSLAQCYGEELGATAGLDDPQKLIALFHLMQALREQNLILACHDRSDGGLWASVCEMAFAARCGLNLDVSDCGETMLAALFSEEPGMLIQVKRGQAELFADICRQCGLEDAAYQVGHPVLPASAKSGNEKRKTITVKHRQETGEFPLGELLQSWWKTSYAMQAARDNPECAQEEYDLLVDDGDPGLFSHLSFEPRVSSRDARHQQATKSRRPRIAILREQGTNGHAEMAAAFDRVGFRTIDVHMSDLLGGQVTLDAYVGLAICGGFSFGDALGAGRGWAASIRYHTDLREQFKQFFTRDDTFTLGVCNGCQMLAELSELVPGAECWPKFGHNRSEQFEARLSMVEVTETPSILLRGMAGSQIPVVVSHGEGRVVFSSDATRADCEEMVCLRHIDNYGNVTERYPANPNGSRDGVSGLCNADGRVTIMMPHPERLFRNEQFSWRDDWGDVSPWLRLFDNAYQWTQGR